MHKVKTQQHIIIDAHPADVGGRLDIFLTKKMPQLSRSQVIKLIKSGLVISNGALVKASQIICGNEQLKVTLPKVSSSTIQPQNIALDILFSDEHIAVINKPCGLVVHPGAGVKDKTLCNALLYHFPNMCVGDVERPGIVHRLDKATSGVMVIAKTQAAHQALSEDFKNRRVTKIYRAFCWGNIHDNKFDLVTGHARHPYNRLKYFTKLQVPKIATVNVRMAHTSFTVVRRAWGITEVDATLHTGRTHQIRAHLCDIDHPLLGDELYGGKRSCIKSAPQKLIESIASLDGQALHAIRLAFAHPHTKEPLSFTAPLPIELVTISDVLQRA